jgi:translation elongation factor P/translation initiation factor 5A
MNKSELTAKKIRGQWTEDQMKLAIDKVGSKEMSVREEADTFSVPKSSLGDRLTKLKEGQMVKIIPTWVGFGELSPMS